MKKIITIVIAFLAINSYAQNEVDALRYSQQFYNGTARYMSMGGAFGALGGDISSVSVNPAGIGLYRKSEFTITPGFNYNSVESNFNGSKYTDGKYKFKLNNVGYVGSFSDEGNNEGWINTSFAFSYNKLNDFNQNMVIQGKNNTSSYLDLLTYNVNNNFVGDLEQLAIDALLIYNIVDGDTLANYINDYLASAYGQFQRKLIFREGGMGEYNLSFAANYNHKFYIGGGLGIQRIIFSEHSEIYENDVDDVIPFLNSFTFTDHYEVYGKGFNLKFGMIYKPIQALRIGASVHTPTFYDIEEEFYSEVEASIDLDAQTTTNDHFKTELTKTPPYELTTPFKAIGSIAFVIRKAGIFSIEYEYLDYSKSRMRDNSDYFITINDNISTRYTSTGNLRTGAEIRTGPISLRAGYALYGSPYASSEANKNMKYSVYSAGIGTRGESYFFDIAYTYANSNEKYFLYGIEEASLLSASSQLIATLGFRF